MAGGEGMLGGNVIAYRLYTSDVRFLQRGPMCIDFYSSREDL